MSAIAQYAKTVYEIGDQSVGGIKRYNDHLRSDAHWLKLRELALSNSQAAKRVKQRIESVSCGCAPDCDACELSALIASTLGVPSERP